ncbi:MAG: CHAT domain-containing protein [Anaerolineae bacterium]
MTEGFATAERRSGLEFESFELLVGPKADGGYPLTVVQAPAGDAKGLCRLDLAAADLQATLGRLGEGGADEALLARFGQTLFEALFSGEVLTAFRASLGQVRGQGRGLRLRLRLEPPELAALPWEYLYDARQDYFPALSPETPLTRYVPLPGPTRPAAVSPPLRLLVVISNPQDAPALDVARERAIIEEALQEPAGRGLVHLRLLERAVVADISQAMRDYRPHVFHFIGHGRYVERGAMVLLENEAGQARPIGERAFREFFLGQTQARLAVLNACQTATTSSAQPLAGLSPRLLQRNLSGVVAMQYPMPDRAALVFAREFYRSLALGYPVDAAVAEARKGIYLEVSRHAQAWGIPVLFLRAPDGRLFEVTPAEAEPAASEPASPAAAGRTLGGGGLEIGQIQAGIVNVGGEQTFSGDLTLSPDFSQTTTHVEAGGTVVQGDQFNLSGDFRGSNVNVRSQLQDVAQTVQALPEVDLEAKDELARLLAELSDLLAQAPPAKAGQVEKVSKGVQTLVQEASETEPDPDMVEIRGESLKRAAQNLAEAMPAVLSIATQIVAHVSTLVQ